MKYIAEWDACGKFFKAIVEKQNTVDKDGISGMFDWECKVIALINSPGFNIYAAEVGVKIGRMIPFKNYELTELADPVDILKDML